MAERSTERMGLGARRSEKLAEYWLMTYAILSETLLPPRIYSSFHLIRVNFFESGTV